MRFKYVIFALSSCFLVAGVSANQEQSQPAEKVFKNIQVLKGDPDNSVVPAMQFICASLKVDCDFCHTQDRASDEKPEKKTAREMITMTRQINTVNFNGRNQVTCATCHAGHTRPMNLPPVLGAEVRARRARNLDTQKLFDAYTAAIGPNAERKVQTLALSGTGTLAGKEAPTIATYSGSSFRLAHDKITVGSNGTQTWYSDGTHVYPMPKEVATQFGWETKIYFGGDTLPKLDNPLAGTAQINGKDVQTVSGTITGTKDRATFYFDKQSGLLTRAMYLQPTTLGNLPFIVEYSDYRKIDGVEIPMTIETHSAEGDSVWHFKTAKVNSKVDPSIFESPKGSG